ncbi:tRNA 2-selenouridine(34) synthase MnmH [Paracoccus pacificus]|uniref:tRNA 2-selenouridine(34) synthase MnmH n=1 Tax=Paracoccus pacificus TaxID=1463598 RepID=A0ABW4R7J3_9RHOB
MTLASVGLAVAGQPDLPAFDDVIDVRSPGEFAEDHLPSAINLPVLDDAERAQVGTIYKQVSAFDARRIGAAMVAANAARHLATVLSDRGGGWRPLVYCWRGGQRSGAFSTILEQVGWRVSRLQGGYKAWRQLVTQRVEQRGFDAPLIVLDGNTGSAKTEILSRLAARGIQTVDLESLANHRGSLFGHMPGGQPAQKLWEGRLALAVERLDPARPVVVEAESSRIGDLMVPRAIWRAICDAPRIRLAVPAAARAAHVAHVYRAEMADPQAILGPIEALSKLHPAERIAEWQAQALSGDWARLAQGLMQDHYDPRYEKHRARYDRQEKQVISAPRLDEAGLEQLTDRVAAAVGRLAAQPR